MRRPGRGPAGRPPRRSPHREPCGARGHRGGRRRGRAGSAGRRGRRSRVRRRAGRAGRHGSAPGPRWPTGSRRPSATARARATTVRARAPVTPTARCRPTGSRAASASGAGKARSSPSWVLRWLPGRHLSTRLRGRRRGPRRGGRRTGAPRRARRAGRGRRAPRSRRVGAAGHPQVRPGPHERAEHRVVRERGDAGCRVEVEPDPAASRGGDRRRRHPGRRRRRSTGVPTAPGGRVTVRVAVVPPPGRDEPPVAARPVGAHLHVVEARHGVRDEERPQRRQVDELGGHPGIKPHGHGSTAQPKSAAASSARPASTASRMRRGHGVRLEPRSAGAAPSRPGAGRPGRSRCAGAARRGRRRRSGAAPDEGAVGCREGRLARRVRRPSPAGLLGDDRAELDDEAPRRPVPAKQRADEPQRPERRS